MSILPDRSLTERAMLADRVFPMVAHSDEPHLGRTLHGICPLCGRVATFDGFTANERESGHCSECGCINRQRQIGIAIRELLGLPADGEVHFREGFRLHNTEARGPIHEAFSGCPGYTSSEFLPDGGKSGILVGGIRHEDLQALSFESQSIDLIISSDVFEHIPNPYVAHGEVYRVLKVGGRHIFTVPFYPWEGCDEVRARIVNGELRHYAEPIYHDDPLRSDGALVFTIFGLEMIVNLTKLGFEVSYWNLHKPEAGIIGPWSIVFEARRVR